MTRKKYPIAPIWGVRYQGPIPATAALPAYPATTTHFPINPSTGKRSPMYRPHVEKHPIDAPQSPTTFIPPNTIAEGLLMEAKRMTPAIPEPFGVGMDADIHRDPKGQIESPAGPGRGMQRP